MKHSMKVTEDVGNVVRLESLSPIHDFLRTSLRRQYVADDLNKVVNHPEVIDWVRGTYTGDLDLTPIVRDTRHVLLMGEHGGVIFIQHQPGLYEAHTQVLPSGRGEWALNLVRAAAHYMFTHTDAVELVTRVPKGNLGARALVRAVRSTFEFRRQNGWVFKGQHVYCDIFALRIQDWMRTAEGLTERGEWFHNKLEVEFEKAGKTEPNHPDDPTHDRYVGAAVEMILGGQPYKAIIFYNRWAKMAGYEEVKIVTNNPLVIDIVSALIMIRDQDFWVMACR